MSEFHLGLRLDLEEGAKAAWGDERPLFSSSVFNADDRPLPASFTLAQWVLWWYNQGQVGSCAGNSVTGCINAANTTAYMAGEPFKVVEFDIMYGEGISKTGELVDLGSKAGIIEKSGSWFSMGEMRLGQGRDAVKQYLKENPDLADKIVGVIDHHPHRHGETAKSHGIHGEAEEIEGIDQGKMLERVIALQDLMLSLGIDGINQWLQKIEGR